MRLAHMQYDREIRVFCDFQLCLEQVLLPVTIKFAYKIIQADLTYRNGAVIINLMFQRLNVLCLVAVQINRMQPKRRKETFFPQAQFPQAVPSRRIHSRHHETGNTLLTTARQHQVPVSVKRRNIYVTVCIY